MTAITSSPTWLPRVLALDAASCVLVGAAQLLFTDALARLTGLPAGLLMGTGLFLLAYAALAAVLARRRPVPRTLVGWIALGNFAWALGCVALLASGIYPVTGLGMAWVLAQAVTVLLLAEAQWLGLRASRARGAAVPG